MRRKLAAGNWKMNGTLGSLDVVKRLGQAHAESTSDIVICPPATLLQAAAKCAADSPIAIGAQDCHAEAKGAHTGDLSAGMISDIGARYVIVGHSERREAYGESDAAVSAKAHAAQNAGLTAIVCIGESLKEREEGMALDVIASQLEGSVPEESSGASLVVAYEPIWAIGTGKIPSMGQIAEVHALMREQLRNRFGEEAMNIRLLYGGSVKPGNAAEIFALEDVDGALVGGASLTVEDFSPIVTALSAS